MFLLVPMNQKIVVEDKWRRNTENQETGGSQKTLNFSFAGTQSPFRDHYIQYVK